MNTKFIIAIGAAAAAAAYFFKTKKEAYENLKISFLDAAIDKSNTNWFSKIAFKFKLKLINDAPVNIKVKKINLDVFANGSKIADINTSNVIIVERENDKVITLSTSIQTSGVIDLISNVIIEGNPLIIKLVGIVQTDLGNININYTTNASN
jgi:LEA14-like dessication related protein